LNIPLKYSLAISHIVLPFFSIVKSAPFLTNIFTISKSYALDVLLFILSAMIINAVPKIPLAFRSKLSFSKSMLAISYCLLYIATVRALST
jgi:hypothetical protein